jgi:ribosome-binding protein aMBF1 (putative translation factor)
VVSMDQTSDFLDEIIAESTARDPLFPQLLDAAMRKRRLVRALAERRIARGLSQTAVAKRMQTSQSAVARLEAGELDPKLSTLDRYALAVGGRIEWRLVDEPAAPAEPRASAVGEPARLAGQ